MKKSLKKGGGSLLTGKEKTPTIQDGVKKAKNVDNNQSRCGEYLWDKRDHNRKGGSGKHSKVPVKGHGGFGPSEMEK